MRIEFAACLTIKAEINSYPGCQCPANLTSLSAAALMTLSEVQPWLTISCCHVAFGRHAASIALLISDPVTGADARKILARQLAKGSPQSSKDTSDVTCSHQTQTPEHWV